jgi:hypothetical protein
VIPQTSPIGESIRSPYLDRPISEDDFLRSEFYKDMDYDEWIFGKNSFRMFHSESSVGPVSESATHEREGEEGTE